jgi:hypothetical protein
MPQDVTFEAAFVVEGHKEDELPEVLLGVGKFNRIDVKKATPLRY